MWVGPNGNEACFNVVGGKKFMFTSGGVRAAWKAKMMLARMRWMIVRGGHRVQQMKSHNPDDTQRPFAAAGGQICADKNYMCAGVRLNQSDRRSMQ